MKIKFKSFTLVTRLHIFLSSDSKEARRGDKAKEDGLHASSAHDSSYFEIPTKEGHMANNGIHEIPTKDTEGTATHTATGKLYISYILVSSQLKVPVCYISFIKGLFVVHNYRKDY